MAHNNGKYEVKIYRGRGGRQWGRWLRPETEVAALICCDCGLVHDMQYKPAPRFLMRLRRNDAATKRERTLMRVKVISTEGGKKT